MSWSYSGDPAASDTDAVRFHMQDTDTQRQLLADEEINYLIFVWKPKYGSLLMVAAVCCEVIAAKFAREVSVSADGVSVNVSELQGKYNDLASSLRDQYKLEQAASPMVEGILHSGAFDPTIEPLRFGVGFHDNYLAGRQDYGDYDPGSAPSLPNPGDVSWWPTE